jgi:hypothetical protein
MITAISPSWTGIPMPRGPGITTPSLIWWARETPFVSSMRVSFPVGGEFGVLCAG